MIGRLELVQASGGAWTVKLNGADIADNVCALTLRVDGAGMPATATLELIDWTGFSGEADVVIDPVLHSILLKLGWTAPDA